MSKLKYIFKGLEESEIRKKEVNITAKRLNVLQMLMQWKWEQ